MLSKILVTLLVITAAAVLLRRRGAVPERETVDRARSEGPAALIEAPAAKRSEARFAAYLFLAVMLGVAGFLFWQDWREESAIITVTLYREGAAPVTYEARRGDLRARSFTTLDGLQVRVASDERMELSGLPDE